jgi:hypothetical protein
MTTMSFNVSEIKMDKIHHVEGEFEQDGKIIKFETYVLEDEYIDRR